MQQKKTKKARKHLAQALKDQLLLEVGLKCPVPKCTHEEGLEIHHIDDDPSNDDPMNLLVLCSFHHTQATYGRLSKRMCRDIKHMLIETGHRSFSGVKYYNKEEFELLDSRTAFFNEAIRLISLEPRKLRIMLVGPVFLHPDWIFARRDKVETRPSFARQFQSYLFGSLAVDRDIRILLNNTERYIQVLRKLLKGSELQRFKTDVLANLRVLVEQDVHRSVGLCCLNPGYYQMVYITERACLETSRETIDTPIKGGAVCRDPFYISKQIDKFDRIYDNAFQGVDRELNTLRHFVDSIELK
jgi:hypothetical protein